MDTAVNDLNQTEYACHQYLIEHMDGDPAHDISHVQRVVQNTRQLSKTEGGDARVALPAAWLHDCVSVAKDSPLRKQASKMAADQAMLFLKTIDYPQALLQPIYHAIEAHSFSAAVSTETLEAKIVQDADRLEALGAIGISRCLLTGGSLGRPLYDPDDPFARQRKPDDLLYTIDHFYCKLLGLAETMQTTAGKAEAVKRTEYMRAFLQQLEAEIGSI